ncbi:hypothetical protein M3J09_011154 [Ascochyta lentis]
MNASPSYDKHPHIGPHHLRIQVLFGLPRVFPAFARDGRKLVCLPILTIVRVSEIRQSQMVSPFASVFAQGGNEALDRQARSRFLKPGAWIISGHPLLIMISATPEPAHTRSHLGHCAGMRPSW